MRYEVEWMYFEKDEDGWEIQTFEKEQFNNLIEAIRFYESKIYSGKYEYVRIVVILDEFVPIYVK